MAAAGGVAALQTALRRMSGRPVVVVLTDNRVNLLSCRVQAGVTTARVHRRFVDAPDGVVAALAELVAGGATPEHGARAREALRRWWRGEDGIPSPEPGQARHADDADFDLGIGEVEIGVGVDEAPGTAAVSASRLAGPVHDLFAYARHLNETYLDGRSRAEIRWGPRTGRRATRTMRLGCYIPSRNRIVMNRRLDTAEVPRHFIEYVLFHEMLHEVLGIGERPDGRRDIHGKLFKLMERTYPDVDRALAFERAYFGG